MPQETITLNVSKSIAQEFAAMPEDQQKKASMMFGIWLKESKHDPRPLQEVMQQMRKTAKQNGLTQEILDEILADES